MISYAKLFMLLEERKIHPYTMRRVWGIASNTEKRLKKDLPVSLTTIDKLCSHLSCRIEDIVEYVPDEEIT